MSVEGSKALARAAIALWSTGDTSRVGEILAPSCDMRQHHDPEGAGDPDMAAGTRSGAHRGTAPNGRRRACTGAVIDRVEDGRIREGWGNRDLLGQLERMGARVGA